MNTSRGDVVVLDFPQSPGHPPKRRPAGVVQSDHNNGRLSNSIFAMVTTNTRLAATEPTQVLVDIATPDGKQSGLARTSAIKCENLYTLPQAAVRRVIGHLSVSLTQELNNALKAALELP